jgi:Tol biopolymer transport system component
MMSAMDRRWRHLVCAMTAAAALGQCAGSGAATVPRPPAGEAALAVSVAVQHGAVALVGANGTGVRILAVGNGPQQLVNPAWSPDGHRLAYTSTQPAVPGRAASSTVFVDRLPGFHPRALTAERPGRIDDDAAFSPLGTRVAFARTAAPGQGSQIMVVSSSFGPPTALTSGRSGRRTVNDSDPAWSPGGTLIAFTRTIGASSSIWVMRPNGTAAHRLIGDGRQPTWAPDGQRLAFASTRDRHGRCGRRACAELYVARSNGTLQRRLSTSLFNEADPAWSPDGALIAYTRGGPGRTASAVFTVDTAGTCPFRVTGTATVSTPAWRPGLAPPKLLPGC